MKIKKNKLTEDTLANAVARDATKLADKINAEDNIAWKEDSLEAELESAYRANILNKRKELRGKNIDAWNNVLLVGGAGVGKTARIKQWAKTHPNLRVEAVDAKTLDPADLGGAIAPDRETGKRAVRLSTTEFDRLDNYEDEEAGTYVVLFLDELNRAPDDVRGSLLTLVNNHEIPDNLVKGGWRKLTGLLFTVAAINPADASHNTNALDAAERSRFKRVDVTAENLSFLKYILGEFKEEYEWAVEDGDEAAAIAAKGKTEIAKKILNDPLFSFDNSEEVDLAQELDTQILTPRTLSMLFNECDGTKKSFLKGWSKYCNPAKKGIVEASLKDYKDIDNKANSVFKTGQGRLNGKQADQVQTNQGQTDQGQNASIFQKKELSAFDKFAKYKKDNGIAFSERA